MSLNTSPYHESSLLVSWCSILPNADRKGLVSQIWAHSLGPITYIPSALPSLTLPYPYPPLPMPLEAA